MATRRFSRKPPTDLCSTWTADDGIDPRHMPRRPQGKVSNRKALQLCRQVERVLSFALEGDILRDLTVASVVPAPDSSRLLATVVFHGAEPVGAAEIVAALKEQHARLRAAIAAAIHRKKTPELAYQVVKG